jgi:hypothetical protein
MADGVADGVAGAAGAAYALQLVLDRLKALGVAFEYHSVGVSFYETGCTIRMPPDGRRRLSVQTHPVVCGDAFAQTAVLLQDGWGNDVRRFYTLDALFQYIQDAVRSATPYNTNE